MGKDERRKRRMQAMQADRRRREIQALWVGAKRLGLSREEVHELLDEWFGKTSVADLTQRERHAALDRFREMGYARKPDRLAIENEDDPLVKKIKAQWLHLHRMGVVRSAAPHALHAYVKRMTGVDHVRWLTPRQAATVIESLKAWTLREEAAREKAERRED